MAKRFTDTDIWDKDWFMALSCKHKCLIRFIFDKCDVAGIWSPNWPLATTYIGEKVTEEDLQAFDGRIRKLESAKFFVADFITFQYGNLSETSKPHAKVISILKKNNLLEENSNNIKGYLYPLEGVKEKEEEEDKEKEQEKEEGGVGETKPKLIVLEISNPEVIEEAGEDQPTDVFIDEEEYTAALSYLKSNTMFTLTQKQRDISEPEAIRLFRIFFEQKTAFREMPKTKIDVVKNFFYWTSKYLNSAQHKSSAGAAPSNQAGKGKVQNLIDIAQNVQYAAGN